MVGDWGSQGGRQGYQLAQRYPDAYDGIAASAPAINWNEFAIQDLWPLFVLDQVGAYPPACEINAITEAALEACDDIDGTAGGVITDSARCEFDPATIVGARSLRTNTKCIQIRYTRIDDLGRFCKYLCTLEWIV